MTSVNFHFPFVGTATVEIHLTDVNDMAPYFNVVPAVGNVTENRIPETEVVAQLNHMVDDADLTPNKGPFTYQLLNHHDLFKVGSTSGLVEAVVELDREQESQYNVLLQVTDNGRPTMTSTLTLTIYVMDMNDSPSIPRDLDIMLYMYNGVYDNGVIGDVRPLDGDLVGDYSCSIQTGARDMFSIQEACRLSVFSISSSTNTRSMVLRGSDGIHDAVSYSAAIQIYSFTDQTVDHSVVLRLTDGTVENFLQNLYVDFLSGLTLKAQESYPTAVIVLYSMYDVQDTTHLIVAIQDREGLYIGRHDTIAIIREARIDLQRVNVYISDVDYQPCASDPCMNNGRCSQEIQVSDFQ